MAPSTRSRKRKETYADDVKSHDATATKKSPTTEEVTTSQSTGRVLRSRSQAVQNEEITPLKTALASPPARRTRSRNASELPVEKIKIPNVTGLLLKENVKPNEVRESDATILLRPQLTKRPLSASSQGRSQPSSPGKRRNCRGRQRRVGVIADDSDGDKETTVNAEAITEKGAIMKTLTESMQLLLHSPVEPRPEHKVTAPADSQKISDLPGAELQQGEIEEAIQTLAADAVNKSDDVEDAEPSSTFVTPTGSRVGVEKERNHQECSPAISLQAQVSSDMENANKATVNDIAPVAESLHDSTESADSATMKHGAGWELKLEGVQTDMVEVGTAGTKRDEDSAGLAKKEPDLVGNEESPSVEIIAINNPPLPETSQITATQNSPICGESSTLATEAVCSTGEKFDQSCSEQLFQYSISFNSGMALDPRLMSSPPVVSINGEKLVNDNVSEGYISSAESSNTSAQSPTVIIPSQRSFLEFSRRMDKYNRLRNMFRIGHIPRSPSALAFYRRAYSDASSEAASEADDMNTLSGQESNTTSENPKSSPVFTSVSQLTPLQGHQSDSDGSDQFMDSFENFDFLTNQTPPLHTGNCDGTQISDQTGSNRPYSFSEIQTPGPAMLPPSPPKTFVQNKLDPVTYMPDEASECDVSISIESPPNFPRLVSIGCDASDISDFLPEDIIQWEWEQRQQEACWVASAQSTPLKGGSTQVSLSRRRSSWSIASPTKIDSPTRLRSPASKSPLKSESPLKQSSPSIAPSPNLPGSSPVRSRSPIKKSPIKMPSPVRLMSFMQRLSPVTKSPLKIVSLPDEGSGTGAFSYDMGVNAKITEKPEKDGIKETPANGVVDFIAGTANEDAEEPDTIEESQSGEPQTSEVIMQAPMGQQNKSDAITEEVHVETDDVIEESDSENDFYFDSVANVSSEMIVSAAEDSVAAIAHDRSESVPTTDHNIDERKAVDVDGNGSHKYDNNDSENRDQEVPAAGDCDNGVGYDSGDTHIADFADGKEVNNEERSATEKSMEDSNESEQHVEGGTLGEEHAVMNSAEESATTIVPTVISERGEQLANNSVQLGEHFSEFAVELVSIEQKEDVSGEVTVGSSNYFASDENTSDIDYTTVLPWNISLDRWAELNKRQGKCEALGATAEKKEDKEDSATRSEQLKSPARSPPKRRYMPTPARASARSSLKRKPDSTAASVPILTTLAACNSDISIGSRSTRSHTTPLRKTTAHLTKITETNSRLNTGFENIVIPQYQYKRGKRPESPPPDRRKRQRSMKNESPLKRERKIKFASELATIAGKSTTYSGKRREKCGDLKPIIKVGLNIGIVVRLLLIDDSHRNILWMSLGMQCLIHHRRRSGIQSA
ncbi:uncharacterized protein V1513DRAFT_447973 [Lipomyces chichibuensis]|uniref:uncharacterized protein n=1 Tax=Lipomyces chichibuensis TaxID=1546026 RepID=UPI0033441510